MWAAEARCRRPDSRRSAGGTARSRPSCRRRGRSSTSGAGPSAAASRGRPSRDDSAPGDAPEASGPRPHRRGAPASPSSAAAAPEPPHPAIIRRRSDRRRPPPQDRFRMRRFLAARPRPRGGAAPGPDRRARATARAAATITAADVARRIGIIADDSMLGRDTPSRGLELTAHYVADQFRRFGLRPAGEDGGWLQRYPDHPPAVRRRGSRVTLLEAGGVEARGAVRPERALRAGRGIRTRRSDRPRRAGRRQARSRRREPAWRFATRWWSTSPTSRRRLPDSATQVTRALSGWRSPRRSLLVANLPPEAFAARIPSRLSRAHRRGPQAGEPARSWR